MEDDPAAAAAAAGITDAVLASLVDKGKELSKGRKKRPIPATLATAADVATFGSTSSGSPHATKASGLLCVDLLGASTTVTGGNDKAAIVFDHGKGQVLASLSGHAKKVTAAVFHPDFASKSVVVTGSADKSVKIWATGHDFSSDACTSVSPRAPLVPNSDMTRNLCSVL
jgi:pre-mRNA-processing factor 19